MGGFLELKLTKWSLACILAMGVLAGCGTDSGTLPDNQGPPPGGPPTQTEHPPGLSDAEKDAAGR